MAHSYAGNFVHCVFSTKERRNTIPADLQEKLWAYLFGIARNHKIEMLAIGGTCNHVHLLVSLPPTIPLALAVQKLKANSSRWLSEHGSSAFEWQKGYGAFSVSASQLSAVQNYIQTQLEHHKKHLRRRVHFVVTKVRAEIRGRAGIRMSGVAGATRSSMHIVPTTAVVG